MLKVTPHNLGQEQLFFFAHRFNSLKGIMIVFITPIILFLVCTFLIKKLIPFLKRMSLLDYPSHRSNHNILIPKGAGIILIPLLIISVFGIFISRGF